MKNKISVILILSLLTILFSSSIHALNTTILYGGLNNQTINKSMLFGSFVGMTNAGWTGQSGGDGSRFYSNNYTNSTFEINYTYRIGNNGSLQRVYIEPTLPDSFNFTTWLKLNSWGTNSFIYNNVVDVYGINLGTETTCANNFTVWRTGVGTVLCSNIPLNLNWNLFLYKYNVTDDKAYIYHSSDGVSYTFVGSYTQDGAGTGSANTKITAFSNSNPHYSADMTFYLGDSPYKTDVNASINASLDLLFSNETNVGIYKTLFAQSEHLYVYANWTTNTGTPLNDSVGNCTYKNTNHTITKNALNNNFTVCNTGCDYKNYNETKTYPTDTQLLNVINFKACHVNSPLGDLQACITCGAFTECNIISGSNIALCSNTTTEIFSDFKSCLGNNLTISYNVSGVGLPPVSKAIRIEELKFLKVYENFSDNMTYNDTTKLWVSNTTQEYKLSGLKDFNVTCTHNTESSYDIFKSETITIQNAPPLIIPYNISLPSKSYPIFNGVTLEYEVGDWYFFGTVSDLNLYLINITIYNSSNELIYNQEIYNFTEVQNATLNNSYFTEFANPYNFTVYAEDEIGANSSLFFTFYVNDTTNPVCLGLNNYVGFAPYVYYWGVNCSDENFYSFNFSCTNGVSYYVDGLNAQTFSFINNSGITNNTYCSYEYCDGHTAKELKKEWMVRDYDNRIEFEVDGFINEIKGKDDIFIFDATREKDRYTFNFTIDKFKDSITLIYTTSEDATYLIDDEYKAWIIDPKSQTWFDLNTNNFDSNLITYDVERWNSTTWYITLNLLDKTDKLKFKSIGELNCVSGAQEIKVYDLSSNNGFGEWLNTTCPLERDTGFVIGFIAVAVFLIWLFVWNIRNYHFPLISLFVGICFIGYSVAMFRCSVLMSVPFGVFGLLLMIIDLLLAK